MIPFLAFSVPLITALTLGLRAGKRDPQSIRDFWVLAAWAVAWAVGIIFLWHCLWITSALPAPWFDTVKSGFYWTLGTGAIWLPVLMITFVLRAMKARRS